MHLRICNFSHRRYFDSLLIGIASLCGAVTAAPAADAMPDLAVDPALLGDIPAKVAPVASAAGESVPTANAAVADATSELAKASQAASTPVQPPNERVVVTQQTAPVTPVTPLEGSATTPAVLPRAATSARPKAVAAPAAVALTVEPARTAVKTLPALRVDPALLGNGNATRYAASTDSAPLAIQAGSAAEPQGTPPVFATDVASMGESAPRARVGMPRSRISRPLGKKAASKVPVAAMAVIAPSQPKVVSAATVAAPRVSTLPALRVDPALLGEGQDVRLAAPAMTLQTPPEVAVQPGIAPTYSAHMAAGVLPGPKLKSSAQLLPYISQPDEQLPTFITANNMTGQTDVQVVAQGDVDLRRQGTVLKSDKLTHWQTTDEVEAEGNVDLVNEGTHVRGPKMRMNLSENTGFFEQPEYQIRQPQADSSPVLWTIGEIPAGELTTGQGVASRIDFEGKGKYRLTDATYSTCTPAAGESADWFAKTANLRLDYVDQVGVASNAAIYFKGVPILYSPWMSFSLNNERKSGLLTPTLGSTSRGGFEFTQPLYWNIAPNMDATIAPRIITKRGVLWNGEFRYLQPDYAGIFNGQLLPNDRLEERQRSAYSYRHTQNFGYGINGAIDLNYASDGTYFSDFGSNSAIIAQTNLLRQGSLSYGGSWWSVSALAQSYQTLQDPGLPPVVTPYKRLPQINAIANRSDLPLGTEFSFTGEHVNFQHPTLTEGKRFTLYPQLSWPLQTAAFFVTPKVGVHSTKYSLKKQAPGVPDSITRTVPIASIDSGMTFERPLQWFGQSLTQTLEPRLYYLYIPERDQSQIPNFDSGVADFNFAQIFSENRYVGGDRINDANQITGMVTTRLVDQASGAEILRAAFGQRVYFTTQHVGLPGEALRTGRQTDLLGAFTGRVLPKLYVDAGVQYSTEASKLERFNLTSRYQPEIGKLVNAGYRYTRDQLSQIDFSSQWPLGGGWYGVGRYNYSLKDKRLVEAIAGFEYDGDCWVGRVVLQRLATQTDRVNNSIFFQLELNGFAKLGSNPLSLLKRAVPGYGAINLPNEEGTQFEP